MVTLASPGWNKLTQKEKEKYKNRAKEMRGVKTGSSASAGGGGLDAHGRSLQLDNLGQDVADKIFYVMNASVFAKFTELSKTDETITWIPAELAVSKFSINSGLIAAYQAFPLPGQLPVGSKWECFQKEKKILVPLTPEDSGFNKEDKEIFQDLRAFLGSTKTVFVMPELEEQVRGVLDQISKRSELPSLGLTYLSLPRLMSKLKIASCKTEKEKTITVAELEKGKTITMAELEKGKFLYSGSLGCDHHEQVDTAKCCQTIVASWIFSLLDLCCPGFNVELVPGSHAPHQVAPIEGFFW